MGWGSGSCLMRDIICALKKTKIKSKERIKLYKILIPEFEGHDCDTLYECCEYDAAFQQVFDKLNPCDDDDDDDDYYDDELDD